MGKLVKAGACIGGGGLMVGGDLAVKDYLDKDNGSDGTSPSPTLVFIDDEDTLDKALQSMNLTIASTDSDFSSIHTDLTNYGVESWITGIITKQTWDNKKPGPQEIKSKCSTALSHKYSEYKELDDGKNGSRRNKLKTVKIFCTTDYSVMDNARDYVGDENTIHDSSKEIDEGKWGNKISEFKKFKGSSKTSEDFKNECLRAGKAIYRKNSQDKDDFYRFCVITRTI